MTCIETGPRTNDAVHKVGKEAGRKITARAIARRQIRRARRQRYCASALSL